MPNVLGKSEDEAKKALEDLKLTVNVKYGNDTTKANSVVITQSYPQNQSLKEGDLVDITVNKLLISKKVNIDVASLLASANITASADKNVTIKVDASIDSGATNTVLNPLTIPSTQQTVTFTINGYTDAKLTIYVNDTKQKEQTINFKE